MPHPRASGSNAHARAAATDVAPALVPRVSVPGKSLPGTSPLSRSGASPPPSERAVAGPTSLEQPTSSTATATATCLLAWLRLTCSQLPHVQLEGKHARAEASVRAHHRLKVCTATVYKICGRGELAHVRI